MEAGLTPGTYATLEGQAVDLSRTDDAKALADLLAGLGQPFGTGAPADDDDPFAPDGPDRGLGASALSLATGRAASSPGQSITGREVLLGTAFHLAGGGGPDAPRR